MANLFTVHCIDWHSAAPLLQDVRMAASRMGLMGASDARVDPLDARCRHALALTASGKAVGCARLTPDFRIERMVLLPHEHQAQIESAMNEVLKRHANRG